MKANTSVSFASNIPEVVDRCRSDVDLEWSLQLCFVLDESNYGFDFRNDCYSLLYLYNSCVTVFLFVSETFAILV